MSAEDDLPADGRRARGAKRRAEIIAATLSVIRRDGASGVTHRAVAHEAGAPTSLITYHFATLDELLVAALTSVADTYSARIRGILEHDADPLRGLADLIVESGDSGRERALAERELSTLAARRPQLRAVARRWRLDVAELAATVTDDPDAVAAVVAVSDGLCTAALIDDATPDVEHVHAVLRRTAGAPVPPADR